MFGAQMRFNLQDTFPLLTTKKVFIKGVVEELLWFLRGETNVKSLQEKGVHIWDEWADENGGLGPVYGKQWRSWETSRLVRDEETSKKMGMDAWTEAEPHDQIKALVERLKSDPYSRRHIVSAWNVDDLEDMALPPCHLLFQFYVSQRDNSLSCQLYQRSADMFLGVPFNIASYSLLTCMLADTLGFKRGEFVWTGGDIHIYANHVNQVREQLERRPLKGPILQKIECQDIFSVTAEDINFTDYNPHPAIKGDVAV